MLWYPAHRAYILGMGIRLKQELNRISRSVSFGVNPRGGNPRGDFQPVRHIEVGAVDDGFFSNVPVLCGVGNVEAGAALLLIEVIPDQRFVIVCEDPRVG